MHEQTQQEQDQNDIFLLCAKKLNFVEHENVA
jgi:hypothetical protein